MPGLRIEWAQAAISDLQAIRRYIGERNPIAAQHMAQRILTAADALLELPERGRAGSLMGTRELLAIWPYVIVYRVDADALRILRIWHGAQNRTP